MSENRIFFVDESQLYRCMEYMRLDPNDRSEMARVKPLYAAAVIYLRNAGVEWPGSDATGIDNELYYLATHALTLHYYDHRDSVGNESEIPNGLRPIINQLKDEAEIAHIAAQLASALRAGATP